VEVEVEQLLLQQEPVELVVIENLQEQLLEVIQFHQEALLQQ
tara:strand:+ start:96 stop:221 length:126 start_codon:yes stop_codon:yes gene_type:complete